MSGVFTCCFLLAVNSNTVSPGMLFDVILVVRKLDLFVVECYQLCFQIVIFFSEFSSVDSRSKYLDSKR